MEKEINSALGIMSLIAATCGYPKAKPAMLRIVAYINDNESRLSATEKQGGEHTSTHNMGAAPDVVCSEICSNNICDYCQNVTDKPSEWCSEKCTDCDNFKGRKLSELHKDNMQSPTGAV